MGIDRLADRILGQQTFEDDEHMARARRSVNVIFTAFLLSAVVAVLYLIFGFSTLAAATSGLSCLLMGFLVALRFGAPAAAISRLILPASLATLLYLMGITGGAGSPFFPVLIVLSALGFLLFKLKEALVWFAVIFISAAFVMFISGGGESVLPTPSVLAVFQAVNTLGAIALTALIGAAFKMAGLNAQLGFEAEKVQSGRIVNKLYDVFEEGKHIMGAMEEGDLSHNMEMDGMIEEIDQLRMTVNKPIEILRETLYKTDRAADQVIDGFGELSASARLLAQGTTRQAEALEEIKSSTGELESQTRLNSESAVQSQQATDETLTLVQEGNRGMAEVTQSIGSISKTSADVAKVTKTIDDIASRTSLLALNAAVEAARAGEYGRGFTVVADEVGVLATRCKEAARSISQLIDSSGAEVAAGVRNTEHMAGILDRITKSVEKSNELVTQISTASQEQTAAIKEIHKGLGQVNHVVQGNSAISEKTNATAEAVNSQAMDLKNFLTQFKIKGEKEVFVGAQYRCIVSNLAHPSQKAVSAGFAIRDELWKRSKGRIYFDYKPLSLLGGEVAVMDMLKAGKVQGMAVSTGTAVKLSKRFGLINLPFLINSHDKMEQFIANEELFGHFLKGAESQGIIGLDVTDFGAYGWCTKKPVNGLADARKNKLRIAVGEIHSHYFKQWGIETFPAPWTEVTRALQQNQISGLEQTPIACNMTKKFDIAPYFTEVHHGQGVFIWIFNHNWLENLPDDLKTIFTEVVHGVCAQYRKASKAQEEEEIRKAKADGVRFIRLSNGEMNRLKEKGDKTHEAYRGAINKLYGTDTFRSADYLKAVQNFMGY